MSISNQQYQQIISRAECIYTQQQVDQALNEMAQQMNEQLAEDRPIFCCVMRGALVVMGQLLPRLSFPLQIDYLHTSRYRGTTEGGELYWLVKPHMDLNDRTIVLVEDILDRGVTLAQVKDYCLKAGAARVYTAALLDKKQARLSDGVIDVLDFHALPVPNRFLIGCGLDYKELFRNLLGVYALADVDVPK